MKKELICAGLIGLTMAALTACSNVKTGSAETSEAESSAPETYNVNKTSVGDGADSEYEIDDMLPRMSDDTLVISVEEAEALMKKNADAGNQTDDDENAGEQDTGTDTAP